jgi:hypothetical protein
MFKRRLAGITAFFRHRITSAASEGLNSRIQAIRTAARGYRNREHFKTATTTQISEELVIIVVTLPRVETLIAMPRSTCIAFHRGGSSGSTWHLGRFTSWVDLPGIGRAILERRRDDSRCSRRSLRAIPRTANLIPGW